MFAFNRSRRFRQMAATAAFAFAASVGLAGSVARAGTSTVDFSSTSSLKGLAGFKGSATLDGDLLTVQVTNESSKGVLYGLAFDVEGGKAVYQKNDGKHGFKAATGKHGLLIKPFGRYDDALSVAGSKRAIAAGGTRTFLFAVSGESADATALDLLNNSKGESVVALFKGFRHGAHDKAGAAVVLRLAPADLQGTAGGLGTGTDGAVPPAPDFAILPPVLDGSGKTPHTGGTSGTGGSLAGLGGSGGVTGNGPAPAAIPLPPAAWTGLGTMVVLAGAKLKRRGLRSLT